MGMEPKARASEMRKQPDILRTAAGLLALQFIRGVGPKTALRTAVFPDQLEPLLAQKAGDWDRALADAEEELARCKSAGLVAVSIFDRSYPERLRAIQDPPLVLFVSGSLEALNSDRVVAVVGTREPTEFGCSATEEIVAALAASGWIVVSGLAIGIDTIAHGAALKHHTGTVAVMAAGLDRIYPKQNEELARAIADRNGALVSEYRLGVPPARSSFVQRNRIQTGLSAAVVVTQTGIRGGTMHTVRHAAAQGRPVFCAEPHTAHHKSAGLRALLDTPAERLWETLPAWRDSRALCKRLGSRPLAKPVTRQNLDELLEGLDQMIATDPQTVASPRWWPESEPPSRLGRRDEISSDDEQAPLFAVAD